jgi:hypothetical protein
MSVKIEHKRGGVSISHIWNWGLFTFVLAELIERGLKDELWSTGTVTIPEGQGFTIPRTEGLEELQGKGTEIVQLHDSVFLAGDVIDSWR